MRIRKRQKSSVCGYKYKGQITVMLSLLLTVVMLFLVTCAEGVHIYLGKGRAARCVMSAGESTLAEYHPFLWNRYHILAVQEDYGTGNVMGLDCKLQEYLQNNMVSFADENRFFQYQIEQVKANDRLYLTSQQGEVLKQEITQYMKYRIEKEAVAKLLDITATASASSQSIDSAREKVEKSEQQVKEEEQNTKEDKKTSVHLQENAELSKTEEMSKKQQTEGDKKQAENEQNTKDQKNSVTDPRKELKEILQCGIVELVTGRTDISKETYDVTQFPSKMYGKEEKEEDVDEKEMDFEKAEEVTSHLQTQYETNTITNTVITETLVMQYIVETFSNIVHSEEEDTTQQIAHTNIQNAKETKDENFMQVEIEYLIAGKDSDYKNVKNIIYRLLAIRFPINFAYAVTDMELVSSAETIAACVAGITATPAIIELVKYLLLACLSYAESITELRELYQGGTIAFLKTKENWNIRFSNIGALADDTEETMQTQTTTGMTYEDYLRLLLTLQVDKSAKYMRMLDVMQWNGQRIEEHFQIGSMVYGYQMECKVKLLPMFLGGFENADTSDTGGVTLSFEKYISY